MERVLVPSETKRSLCSAAAMEVHAVSESAPHVVGDSSEREE